MNERIRDIKDKLWSEEYWNNPNTDKLLSAQLKKFAELIVRECVNCSDDLVKHYIANHNESDQTLLLASIADYTSEIKKHFGVEE